MKQYQLPKEFATKWVQALRDNKNKNFTPGVIAKTLKDKSYEPYLLRNRELYSILVQLYIKKDNNAVANWIETNVEFI